MAGVKVILARSTSKISSPAVIGAPESFRVPFEGRLTILILVIVFPSTSVNLEMKSVATKEISVSSAPDLEISETTGGSFTLVTVTEIV